MIEDRNTSNTLYIYFYTQNYVVGVLVLVTKETYSFAKQLELSNLQDSLALASDLLWLLVPVHILGH